MAPKRAADAEEGTAVRKKRKTSTPTPGWKSRFCNSTTMPYSKRAQRLPQRASTELQLAAGKNKLETKRTAARDAVMGTQDLFEAILSFLPAEDILVRGQRVCKNWKNVIATSPTIQTRLWFKSQASEPISPDLLSAVDPLLTSPWTQESRSYRDQLERNHPLYNGNVMYNPLFYCVLHERSNDMPHRGNTQPAYNYADHPVHHSFDIDDFEKLSKVQRSWLDMYLTEPPVTTAQLNIDTNTRDESDESDASEESDESDYDPDPESQEIASELVHDPCGLTFRAIMDKVNQISADWPAYRRVYLRPGLSVVAVELFAGEHDDNAYAACSSPEFQAYLDSPIITYV